MTNKTINSLIIIPKKLVLELVFLINSYTFSLIQIKTYLCFFNKEHMKSKGNIVF